MAATLYGTLSAPLWGTTDETALGIIVTKLEKVTDAEETTMPNGQGDIVHVAYHGAGDEYTCEFKVQAAGYPAAALVATTVTLVDTVFAGTYIVKTVSNVKEQGQFMGGSMTLRNWAGVTTTTTTTT